MSEELNNEQPIEEPVQNVEPEVPATEPVQEELPPDMTQPQVIVQRERGFAHYVGFALLCVLCICFFFMPGIAITYGVSRLVTLNGAAALIEVVTEANVFANIIALLCGAA